jgi:hypothetical protein
VGKGEVHVGSWWGDLSEKNLEDLDVDGRKILKCIFGKWGGGIDWIDLAQDKDR